MTSSRIGETLRAARVRLGWSREALAYHAGMSWAAIAQIESGRRQNVQLSSLTALATALSVSVDYLIGAGPISPALLEHLVLAYGSEDEFLAMAIPFLAQGIERSEPALAVTSAAHIELLQSLTRGGRWSCRLRGLGGLADLAERRPRSLSRMGEAGDRCRGILGPHPGGAHLGRSVRRGDHRVELATSRCSTLRSPRRQCQSCVPTTPEH